MNNAAEAWPFIACFAFIAGVMLGVWIVQRINRTQTATLRKFSDFIFNRLDEAAYMDGINDGIVKDDDGDQDDDEHPRSRRAR